MKIFELFICCPRSGIGPPIILFSTKPNSTKHEVYWEKPSPTPTFTSGNAKIECTSGGQLLHELTFGVEY